MNFSVPSFAGRADYWDVRFSKVSEEHVSLVDSEVSGLSLDSFEGVSVRVVVGGKLGFAFSSNRSDLSSLFRKAFKLSKLSGLTVKLSPPIEGGVFSSYKRVDPFNVDLSEKVKRVRRVNELTKSLSSRVKSVSGGLFCVREECSFLNSEGCEVDQSLFSTGFSFEARGKEGGVLESFSFSNAKSGGLEVFTNVDPIVISESLVEGVEELLRAKKPVSGRFPVVCDPEMSGVFFHEAVGHGCEADLVLQGGSIFKDKIGELVGSELVTLRDGFVSGEGFGVYKFDDDGVSKKSTVLIERGVLKGFLHSLVTASRMGVEPTGNGRASGFGYFPIPRMSNLSLEPGDLSVGELLETVKKGLLVKGCNGGEVSTTNGNFVFSASRAYLVENGEVVAPLKGVVLSGNALSTLKNVSGVGKFLEYTKGGFCGKAGQSVPVDEFMPFIKVDDVLVGGE